MREASELVQDLLQCLQEDHIRFCAGKVEAASTPATSTVFTETSPFTCSFEVGIEEDACFQVVKRLVGKSGKHLKRIEAESGGARIWVCGRRTSEQEATDGALSVCVSAKTRRSFDKAATLVMALLSRVHADYREDCSLRGERSPTLAMVCHTSDENILLTY